MWAAFTGILPCALAALLAARIVVVITAFLVARLGNGEVLATVERAISAAPGRSD